MSITIKNAKNVNINIKGKISSFEMIKSLEIKDNNIIIEGVDFAEINVDNKITLLENVDHLLVNSDITPTKKEIKKEQNKKQIIVSLPRESKFDDIMDIFSKYGCLDIKISKGNFDNCEDVIITYDYTEDYHIVKKSLDNKQIKLKNGDLPYYRIL